MGWRGHETTICVGMIFKRMFCCRCGTRLERQEITKIYKKGDKDYRSTIAGGSTIGMNELEATEYQYMCPNCGLGISYEKQCKIAKRQKQLKKKVLDENDWKEFTFDPGNTLD